MDDIKAIFAKNLKRLMDSRGENLTELSNRIDVAYSTVSDWLHANKMPRSGSLQIIADHYGVNISDLTSNHKQSKASGMGTYKYVPAGISAGTLCNVDPLTPDDVETIQLPDSVMGRYAGDSSILMMHVNGESMNQTIPDGSLIAVKQYNDIQDLKDGDIVVFADDGDYAVKYFYNDRQKQIVTFIPDSTDKRFSPIMYTYEDLEEENINIIGKVVVYTVVL
ncbi:XRE family transcriptional regulator [Lacticaseibacillus paracasei]|uniref:LexA family protein n=1 Tax=Lacticaseibacillus paracasei TaxID=1597 RepID=UPI002FD983EC